jgi:hypothetical protein
MTAPPAISEGATGPRVKWAQYLLVCRALSCNQIDGIFGPVTKTAVGNTSATATCPPMVWSASEPGPTRARGQPGARRPVRCPEPRSRMRPGAPPVLRCTAVP